MRVQAKNEQCVYDPEYGCMVSRNARRQDTVAEIPRCRYTAVFRDLIDFINYSKMAKNSKKDKDVDVMYNTRCSPQHNRIYIFKVFQQRHIGPACSTTLY